MAYSNSGKSIKEINEEKRQRIVDTLLTYIENNPQAWEMGWYTVQHECPFNALTERQYKGVNAFYLYVISMMKGYTDPRWVTYNQAQELGGQVNKGEKSSEVFYYNLYDRKEKKPFDERTVDDMTYEERKKYMDDNVYPVIKFYQVFNAQGYLNIQERDNQCQRQSKRYIIR